MNLAQGVAVKVSGGWKIRKEDGTLLPKVYSSKEEAEKRIAQMKMFKHMSKGEEMSHKDGMNDDLGTDFAEAWNLTFAKKDEDKKKKDDEKSTAKPSTAKPFFEKKK